MKKFLMGTGSPLPKAFHLNQLQKEQEIPYLSFTLERPELHTLPAAVWGHDLFFQNIF